FLINLFLSRLFFFKELIASDDINLYGYGDTELNAIRDLCKDIEYLYFDLKQSKEKLGEIMKENWEFLKNIIIEL
ncbi:unnamed protein product, partial [marine sediment metagenome]